MAELHSPEENNLQQLITEHIDLWTGAVKAKSSAGRGSSGKRELYGIKKLRELIVELGASGKLTSNMENDSACADAELSKVKSVKDKLDKALSIRASKEKFILTKEIDFPKHWSTCCIGEVACVLGGKRIPKGYKLSEQPSDRIYLRVTDMKQGGIDERDLKYISDEIFQQISKYIINKDDLYITIAGTIGNVGEIPEHLDGSNLTENAAKIVFKEIHKPFFKLLISSNVVQRQFGDFVKQMAQPKLSLASIKKTTIGFPAFIEQKAIVAKVDELMALCDQLEQQTESSLDAHQTLVQTLLDTLLQSTDAEELEQNWQRLSAHFDLLFTTEQSIDQLKQTILQLAVMGKLVPQDPNDEPASELLKRIAAEKEELVKQKKIKKQKPLPPISDDEKSFQLPKGWGICRLGELIPQFQNGASSRGDKAGEEIIVLRLADIKNWKVSLEDTRSIVIEKQSIDRYSIEKGDVLIIRVNGSADIVGRFITCSENYDAIYCDHFIRMRFPIKCYSPEFLSMLGASSLIRNSISNMFVSTAGQKTVNQGHISSLITTVPPLEEQYRIVAKVDQLVALCDQLKAKLTDSKTTQLNLTDALVAQAV